MFEDFLFEMNCADEIGNFRLSDAIQNHLIRVAQNDQKKIKLKLQKAIKKMKNVKDLSFSPSQKAFLINVANEITKKEKKTLKDLANPMNVKFKFASKLDKKKILELLVDVLEEETKQKPKVKEFAYDDEDAFNRLMDAPSKSGEELELEHYDPAKEEPTEEDLKRTMEHPADEVDEVEDMLLLLLARKHLEDLGHLPKSDL